MTIDTLIAALESATEGSRVLDAEIVVALNLKPDWLRQTDGELWVDREGSVRWKSNAVRKSSGNMPIGDFPNFTTSLDAALTLVPEGQWDGQIMWNFGDIRKGGFVELNLANPQWVDPDCEPSDWRYSACVTSYEEQGQAPPQPRPLALAVCIAALKARRAMGELA